MPSYYPPKVLQQMRDDADAAIERLSTWMARIRINDEMRCGNYVSDRFEEYKRAYRESLEYEDED